MILTTSVIMLAPESPEPPTGGGRIRNLSLLNLLREQLPTELVCFGNQNQSTIDLASGKICVSSVARKKAPFLKRLLYPLRPYVVNGFSQEIAHILMDKAPKQNEKSIIWISSLAMAQYIPLAHRLGYKTVLDELNIESAILMQAALAKWQNWRLIPLALQCKYHEARFCNLSDLVVATSAPDSIGLALLSPDTKHLVIPNMVDAETYAKSRTQKSGNTILFVGTLSYFPNIEGLSWFGEQVLPRLRAALGDKMPKIVVAGSNPSPQLRASLLSAGIELHANPPSMVPFLADAALIIVPILSGGGTRLKIIEAMAAGRAIISTHKGAEGLDVTSGHDILLADSPKEFFSAIVRLLRDEECRRNLAEQALTTIQTKYDWRAARPLMKMALELLGS